MAISETSLKDVLLYTFDEINKTGGVKGTSPAENRTGEAWPRAAAGEDQVLLCKPSPPAARPCAGAMFEPLYMS
jgi:hypothetical protein